MLVAAPTGTGKTLTGFLVAIDAAWRAHDAGDAALAGPRVVYVSPLRALAADVSENLERAARGHRRRRARRSASRGRRCASGLRTGDSTPAERTALRKHPPDLLVTTPESLYLLLTSASGRAMFAHTETVVVDEIHAVCRDKRGSHLALSLERLDRLVADHGRRLQRIGLSATQRPIETVASMLSGVAPGREGPIVVDCSAPRDFDVAIELPGRRARDGDLDGADGRRARPRSPSTCSSTARRSSSSTPAPHGRARRAPARRAAEPRRPRRRRREPRRRRAPRQPVDGASAPRRGAAARGGPPRPRRDGVARARHRRRAGRARLPARLAPVDRHVPAARSAARTTRSAACRRAGSSRSTATSSSSAPRCSPACAPATSTASCPPVAPLDILIQQLVAEVAGARRGDARRALRHGDRRRPLRDARARALRRGDRARRARASSPAAAGAARTCTSTG